MAKLILARGLRATAIATLAALIYFSYNQRATGVARLLDQLKLWRVVLAESAVSLLEGLKNSIINFM
jgi:hypothetical protein